MTERGDSVVVGYAIHQGAAMQRDSFWLFSKRSSKILSMHLVFNWPFHFSRIGRRPLLSPQRRHKVSKVHFKSKTDGRAKAGLGTYEERGQYSGVEGSLFELYSFSVNPYFDGPVCQDWNIFIRLLRALSLVVNLLLFSIGSGDGITQHRTDESES
jgi:hypothetical protein